MSTLRVNSVEKQSGAGRQLFFVFSGPFVPVQSGVLTFTHGLSSAPVVAGAYWEAIVANNGFAVGERIYMQSVDGDGARQTSVWSNSSDVGYSLPAFPSARIKSGAASFGLDATNWRIYLYAGA